jgi:hypothetical protein
MKTKGRKTASTGQSNFRRARTERKATKDFNAKLQKAIGSVDWAKVKLSYR